jgi:hypothetical protein
MSKNLSIIFHSNIVSKEWAVLEELCRDRLLTEKDDIILLKVYLILLGLSKDNAPLAKLSSLDTQDFVASLIN